MEGASLLANWPCREFVVSWSRGPEMLATKLPIAKRGGGPKVHPEHKVPPYRTYCTAVQLYVVLPYTLDFQGPAAKGNSADARYRRGAGARDSLFAAIGGDWRCLVLLVWVSECV